MTRKSLSSLSWKNRFIDGTPGDKEAGGGPRQVPGACWSRVRPEPMPNPVLRMWSCEVAGMLGLDVADEKILGGNKIVMGMDPYAQRYGGHQFGNWAGQLGDGRAITLGEVDTGKTSLEIQLKGSGRTPYSRFADGRAVLRSSIREFLCSEAMHHLGVPSTRALSLVTTGEDVIRDVMYDGRPAAEPGAIVCRVADSFIRFGSFQIHANTGDFTTLRALVEYTIESHFPGHSADCDDALIEWLKEVADRTAFTIAHWMRVGFVHGVMNTDNMSIHGFTIDYGPYGWLEGYDPTWTPNTTDAMTKRYRYGQQAEVGAWNIARLLEAIGHLMREPTRLHEALESYYDAYREHSTGMWSKKLGLGHFEAGDDTLISDLISMLQLTETDMTVFFRLLSNIEKPDAEHLTPAIYNQEEGAPLEWGAWLTRWWNRVNGEPARAMMLRANPKYVLRNWMGQIAIESAEKGDYSVAMELHEMLKSPYDEHPEHEEKWFLKRPEWARNRVGSSMLSCSS